MQALEHAKQFVGVLHIEPNAIIFDVVDLLTLDFFGANFNTGRFARFGELEGIGDEINECLF